VLGTALGCLGGAGNGQREEVELDGGNGGGGARGNGGVCALARDEAGGLL
jgi:hypothetical protein